MLREHGVEVDDSDANRWAVAPGPIRALDHVIEPDLSNAAPFLALAAVVRRHGDRARLAARDHPGRRRAARDPGRDGLRGRLRRRRAAGHRHRQPCRGIDVDLHDVGELTPAVAALCALADSPSHLRGIAHIRGHETDRLAALATELGGLGADVTEHADGLSHPAGAACTAASSTPTPTTGWRTPA